jgi:hypothetical protein
MAESVLFVHGTGVRGEGYARTFRLIGTRLAETAGGIPLNGCFWGDIEGARLHADGISVPGYRDTRGTGGPSAMEREVALWSVLYTDPLYELRLLESMPPAGEVAPGTQPPAARLRALVAAYTPSAELLALAVALPLTDAVAEVRSSPEFLAAVTTARVGDPGHVRAFARAVVAHAAVAATGDGGPDLHGATRDAVVEGIVGELGAQGRGIGEWLGRQLAGLAARAATPPLVRRRGGLTDMSTFAAGDILRYQARGDGVRRAIRAAIAASRTDEVTLLAHSLGGIACVDLLVGEHIPQVRGLVTVGSQAPYLYEIGALTSLAHPAGLPDHFPRWLNIYDRRDLLGYVGAGLFPGRVVDVEVDNGQPFPAAHSAYWSNPATWAAVGEFLGSAG